MVLITCPLSEKIINATLNNAVCLGKNKNLLIHMQDENTKLNYNPYGNPISNSYRSRGSGGLTGGAIAAIVIICLAVLLALIGINIFLIKKKTKLVYDESNIRFGMRATKEI